MVLIVEDDPLSRRALQSLIAANGYACQAVPSAEEALEVLKVRLDEPEICLIDIDLPGMSGLQLLQQLHKTHPRMPCSLMSANDHDLAQSAGGRGVPFFPKPLNLNRLFTFLQDSAKSVPPAPSFNRFSTRGR